MKKSIWPMMKVKDIFEVQLGKMLNKKAKEGELFSYLANFNVRWGAFNLSRLNKMAFSEKEKEKFSLFPGDLLMCEGGEIGRCAIWKGSNKPIYYQKALHRLRPIDGIIISTFFYYYMQYIASKGELPKLVGETSIAHLTREKLLSLKVPCPEIAIQDSIVDLLSIWDVAIEKIEKLIAAKEKQFSHLRSRLLNSEKVWKLTKLAAICAIKKGQQLSKINMTEDGKYYVLNGGISPSGFTNELNTLENTITISEGGNSCGFVSFNKEPFWTGGHCYSLNELTSDVDLDFFYHFLKHNEKQIMRLRVGSGLPNIQRKDIENIHISFPNKAEQQQISGILNAAFEEIDILKQLAEKYKTQKRGLMQKILTGEWWVKSEIANKYKET